MTDQNRGAYTPQSDAPLSFDARRSGGGRGPMPITLIFSALILLALVIGGGVAILYHNGARKAGDAPQPVGEAVGTMKAAPEAQNAPAGAPPAAVVAAPAGQPAFTKPPEQPAARPIESTPLPPPPAPLPEVKVAPTPVPVAKAEAPKPPPVAKAPPAKVAEAPKAPPAPVAKAAPAPKAAAAGTLMVQIGAYSSSALATNGWNEVAKMMPGEMAGKTKEVDTVERDGKTLYRARIGGFSTRADAERLCLALLSKGHDCKVV